MPNDPKNPHAVAVEAESIMRLFGEMPGGNTTTTRAVVRHLLLMTDGKMMARGELYEIKAKALGAGVYRLTLAPWKE